MRDELSVSVLVVRVGGIYMGYLSPMAPGKAKLLTSFVVCTN